jgi:hypothetical protein
VPVPMPNDLATFKIPTPFASSLWHLPFGHAVFLRPAELHALATARSAGCAELSRNDLHPDSLSPLFGQGAGVPYGCGMGRPYGGNYGQAPE